MARRPNSRAFLIGLAACSLVILAGCDAEDMTAAPESEEVSTATIAALIASTEDLSTVAGVLSEAGLQSLFDGNAAYTIFAPTDAVFDELDVPLEGEELRAARVAVIRDHIVPGYLTSSDIATAIEEDGGAVEMHTMGGNTLTFSDDDKGLLITSSDGAEAHIAGAVRKGANGTIFPIDGLLKTLDDDE